MKPVGVAVVGAGYWGPNLFRNFLASDAVVLANQNDWLVRETIGMLRRTFARLDVSSRTMYAIVEPGSCFAGLLFELGLRLVRPEFLAQRDPLVDRRVCHALHSRHGAIPIVILSEAKDLAAPTQDPA